MITKMMFMGWWHQMNREALSGGQRLPALYQLSPESNGLAPAGASSLLELVTKNTF